MTFESEGSVPPNVLEISTREEDNRKLEEETLATAVRIVRDAGAVILPDIVPESWVEQVRTAYEEAYWEAWENEQQENPDTVAGAGFQGIPGEFGSQGIPIRMPYMDELAVANPWAMQILNEVMSEDIYLALPYGSNTAAPQADHTPQHVHRDIGTDLPAAEQPPLCVVNISLTEFTPANGSTELWPATHTVPDFSEDDSEELDARASRLPSVRANMPAGSVVVRDMRMWHRGMPNTTDRLRIMLAPVYSDTLPPDPDGFPGEIPQDVWDEMSDAARHVCRFNSVAD